MSQYDGPSDPGQYGNPPQQQPSGSYGAPAYGQPAGPYGSQVAMGPGGTHLDPSTGLVIPDGTQVASVGRRIGAFFLGFLLTIVTLGIGYVIWGLIEWGNGRTPVQRVLGMRCYKNNEFRTFGWGDMFLREFVYWACGIVFLVQIANFIVFVANGKRQALHDMASNCIVVHDPDRVLG
ncbi:RDD family protein [Flexivirga lutea]